MKKLFISIALAVSLGLTGCSVYMAASKKGTSFEDLSSCKTRAALIADGAAPLEVAGLPPNTEAFKALKPHGSTGRAVMHGYWIWPLWAFGKLPVRLSKELMIETNTTQFGSDTNRERMTSHKLAWRGKDMYPSQPN